MQSDPALPAEKHGLAYKQVIVEGRVPRALRTCPVRLLKHPCSSIVADGGRQSGVGGAVATTHSGQSVRRIAFVNSWLPYGLQIEGM